MNKLKNIRYARQALITINFIAILFYAAIYLYATKAIILQNKGDTLLEQINMIPNDPQVIFVKSVILYGLLIGVIYWRSQLLPKQKKLDKYLIALEIGLAIWIFRTLQAAYNGLFLLVFADIFFSTKDLYSLKTKSYWIMPIIVCFSLIALSSYDLIKLLIKSPDINAYLFIYPLFIQNILLFIKNLLYVANMVIFTLSLITYIIYSTNEKRNIEEELRMVAQTNTELKRYIAVTEKIAEDRERKRIAREIHDTLGHALTGISAEIDAVKVLLQIDPKQANEQLDNISLVVREGIQDVRGSLNKLRPGALEQSSLQEALAKMIAEFGEVSQVEIEFNFSWGEVDLEKTTEDTIFRLIEESLTNSVRHGKAKKIVITFYQVTDYYITIQDDGIGSYQVKFGYGLLQMQERLALIGASVAYEGSNGFKTTVKIPRNKVMGK